MNIFKKLFCKHKYELIENNYIMAGWEKCKKCGHEKYTGKSVDFTSFKFPDLPIN